MSLELQPLYLLKCWGKNGGETPCWDYTVDGICESENVVKTMTQSGGTWTSSNIYPDSIYPEIFFAKSSVTWGNAPESRILRRNDYSIMHFDNPFTMVSDMSFFIEINAYPISTTKSADLQVYLVQKNLDITKFNSSWFGTSGVELVGTIDKNSSYHHTHSTTSSHRLIPLSTNTDGTIGTNSIDVSGDFWIVLYSQSPNNNKGWSLQYQPESLCDYDNRWYSGNISGWTTTELRGMPRFTYTCGKKKCGLYGWYRCGINCRLRY